MTHSECFSDPRVDRCMRTWHSWWVRIEGIPRKSTDRETRILDFPLGLQRALEAGESVFESGEWGCE